MQKVLLLVLLSTAAFAQKEVMVHSDGSHCGAFHSGICHTAWVDESGNLYRDANGKFCNPKKASDCRTQAQAAAATTAAAATAPLPTVTAPATTEADSLEAQYKKCSEHYIPAEKCTPEIYAQLEAKDDAPLDPSVALAVAGVKAARELLKNPDSLQVRLAWVEGDVACLTISAQNGFGGNAVENFIYGHNKHGKSVVDSLGENNWYPTCGTMGGAFRGSKLNPGQDVTEQTKQALKTGK